MAYCWRNEIALIILAPCGLQIVLVESIAQNYVEVNLLNNTEYCPIRKTQTMLKLIHSHSSVIQDCCFNMCFVLGGAYCCWSVTSLIRCPNLTGFEV